MYKNITYFNKYKSVKKYEKYFLEKCLFANIIKSKECKNEIIYKTPDVLITINKITVNYLVFNKKKYDIIQNIKKISDL